MTLHELITNKFGKAVAVLSIVGLFAGCASVTDAGLEQIKTAQNPVEQTPDNSNQPDIEETDDQDVIYEEPDMDNQEVIYEEPDM